MPKRKKHPRLPNAYGSIRYLGKGRTNPYSVHPPAQDCDAHGNYIRPRALCYVDDWYVGFAVLSSFHAGTYKPGDELILKEYRKQSSEDLDLFCQRMLADYSTLCGAQAARKEPTFEEVYNLYFEWKYGENAAKKLSVSSRNSTAAAFRHCSPIHDKTFRDLRYNDLQEVVNNCPKKHATKEIIVNLIKQMYKYADINDLCEKDYSRHLKVNIADDEEHGVPFSEEELKALWQHQEDPVVEMLLIMCYSGYRISAYKTIKVDMEQWFFQGGVKTASGKNRIVPMHSCIQPLVERRIKRMRCMISSVASFRAEMYQKLEELNISRHTPHDCRHTFSALCEKYHVNDADRKRMLGHSFGSDITNAVYGHRTLEDLRLEIEKIKI